jgi:hypothetical protein
MKRLLLFVLFTIVLFLPAALAAIWLATSQRYLDEQLSRLSSYGYDLSITVAFVLLFVSIVIYVALLVLRGIKAAWLALRPTHDSDESRVWQYVITIIFIAILFPQTAIAIYRFIVSMISKIFVDLPSRVTRIFNEGMSCASNRSIDDLGSCVPTLFNSTFFSISDIFGSIFSNSVMYDFDIVSLLIAAALFLSLPIIQKRWGDSLSPVGKLWMAYGAISVFSIYLALSAVLAVPLLKTAREIQEISPENLRSRLEGFYSAELGDVSVMEAKQRAKLVDLSQLTARPEFLNDFAVTYLQDALENVRKDTNSTISESARASAEFASSRKGLIDNAVAFYETESAVRIGDREKSQHYLAIISWYTSQIERELQKIEICDSAAIELGAAYDGMVVDVNRILSTPNISFEVFDVGVKGVLDKRQELARRAAECTTGNEGGTITPPSRNAYGTSLGFIGAATTWLLAAESIPVVLVVGLAGFGLLGALVSRFARPQAETEVSIKVVSVVFNGFVAALVVYLAAYGGIAIVSNGDSDPNPYVVFASCLVGAIFADDVWTWARKKLVPFEGGEV